VHFERLFPLLNCEDNQQVASPLLTNSRRRLCPSVGVPGGSRRGRREDVLENRERVTRNEFTARRNPETPAGHSPDVCVQIVLSHILKHPEQQVMLLIREQFPGQDIDFYAPVLKGTKTTIEELVGGLQKPSDADPSPTLLDRLSFCWRILRQADVAIRPTKKSDVPRFSTRQHATAVFRNILPVPLQEPLMDALLAGLRVGDDARHLHAYSAFRWAKAPSELPPPFDRLAKTQDVNLLRTLIWWCVRNRKEEYVEVRPNEPVHIEFAFVVDQVLEDLKGWCGSQIEAFPNIADEVEREFNSWLRYSRLDLTLDEGPADAIIDPEVAKAFVKHNELTTKLKIHRAGAQHGDDARVRQLEAQLRQYVEENRALEERLQAAAGSKQQLPASTAAGSADLQLADLREVMKTIDTKYSFDILNAVQLGEDTHLTLRSFVSHLFYALRKKGFSEYPRDAKFVLTYDMSGLYDCDGFEVPPAGEVSVKVTRKGWAFELRGRWIPVRRARVIVDSVRAGQEAK